MKRSDRLRLASVLLCWSASGCDTRPVAQLDADALVDAASLSDASDGSTLDAESNDAATDAGPGADAGDCAHVDQPDLLFEDVNCDGIDGDASSSIFVSLLGNDTTADGTRGAPFRHIQAAIEFAVAQGKDAVLVATGEYREQVVAADGISLYGGYDPVDWTRSAEPTLLTGASPVLSVVAVDSATVVDLFSFSTEAATAPGQSTLAGRVVDSSAVILRRVSFVATDAVDGASALAPSDADDGEDGGDGEVGFVGNNTNTIGGMTRQSCDTLVPAWESLPISAGAASGGVSTCACTAGGAGGTPYALGGSTGSEGSAGQGYVEGACAGPTSGGARATDGIVGDAGDSGADGTPGANGTGAAQGTFSPEGYVSPVARAGAAGASGSGGGGGGAGGRICSSGAGSLACGVSGGGGGGGGSGGCGGAGGLAGGSGGASVALLVLRSTVVFEEVEATSGVAGDGGAGAPGGDAGRGGRGGDGAVTLAMTPAYMSFLADECLEPSVFPVGGDGGDGGGGGDGGAGGGGAGGPSIGLVMDQATLAIKGSTDGLNINMSKARAGARGLGGRGAGNQGAAGEVRSTLGVVIDE